MIKLHTKPQAPYAGSQVIWIAPLSIETILESSVGCTVRTSSGREFVVLEEAEYVLRAIPDVEVSVFTSVLGEND